MTAAPGRRNTLAAVNPGQLAEAIPRLMRAWISERIEVRIARKSFDGLSLGIEGRGTPARHDIVVTSAMSVRLKAPDGGFAIDTLTPETQWIENRPGLISNDDFASWRWTVRPMRAGRARLHLVISARTAGPDGSTAETALPDQIIEIKVRTNFALAAKRWGGWIAAAVVGGALGKFGESAFEVLRRIYGL
jgi:neural Wiskott-Aldrich syndrome protein